MCIPRHSQPLGSILQSLQALAVRSSAHRETVHTKNGQRSRGPGQCIDVCADGRTLEDPDCPLSERGRVNAPQLLEAADHRVHTQQGTWGILKPPTRTVPRDIENTHAKAAECKTVPSFTKTPSDASNNKIHAEWIRMALWEQGWEPEGEKMGLKGNEHSKGRQKDRCGSFKRLMVQMRWLEGCHYVSPPCPEVQKNRWQTDTPPKSMPGGLCLGH